MVHGIFIGDGSTSKLRATVYDATLPAIALWTLISGRTCATLYACYPF
jgi:hypothetical protein